MKRPLLLIPAGLLLMSCVSHPPETRTSIRLLQDVDYAIYEGESSAVPGRCRVGTKRYPCFAQNGAGQTSFFFHVLHKPVLHFVLKSPDSKGAPAGVRVESDYPVVRRREYPVRSGTKVSLDLHEFEGQMVRITLFRIKRPGMLRMHWIDPVLEHAAKPVLQSDSSLELLRRNSRNRNVLIFTFDALSHSHVGCYGYNRKTTPVIDSVAREGVLWEQAYAPAVYTRASIGSLFTGLDPNLHGALRRNQALNEGYSTIGESFQQNGYSTAIFSTNLNVSPMFGFSQGFQYVWEPKKQSAASDFVPAVTGWLSDVRRNRFFAYIHFREPHFPFQPPYEYMKRFHADLNFQLPIYDSTFIRSEEEKQRIISAYDANIAYVDEQFGKILHFLRSEGLLKNTIVVLLADHGEAFWEHGTQGHNSTVYDETARVPLIMLFPEDANLKAIRIAKEVSTLNLFPSMVDLLGFSAKGLSFSGHSLLPALFHGGSHPAESVFSQTAGPGSLAVRTEGFKLIRSLREDKEELYDLTKDPGERRNVAALFPIVASYHRKLVSGKLEEWKRSPVLSNKVAREVVLDRETDEQLRALGYAQ